MASDQHGWADRFIAWFWLGGFLEEEAEIREIRGRMCCEHYLTFQSFLFYLSILFFAQLKHSMPKSG